MQKSHQILAFVIVCTILIGASYHIHQSLGGESLNHLLTDTLGIHDDHHHEGDEGLPIAIPIGPYLAVITGLAVLGGALVIFNRRSKFPTTPFPEA